MLINPVKDYLIITRVLNKKIYNVEHSFCNYNCQECAKPLPDIIIYLVAIFVCESSMSTIIFPINSCNFYTHQTIRNSTNNMFNRKHSMTEKQFSRVMQKLLYVRLWRTHLHFWSGFVLEKRIIGLPLVYNEIWLYLNFNALLNYLIKFSYYYVKCNYCYKHILTS